MWHPAAHDTIHCLDPLLSHSRDIHARLAREICVRQRPGRHPGCAASRQQRRLMHPDGALSTRGPVSAPCPEEGRQTLMQLEHCVRREWLLLGAQENGSTSVTVTWRRALLSYFTALLAPAAPWFYGSFPVPFTPELHN